MSRKKKKKLQKQQLKMSTAEQERLNGWNCPAEEIAPGQQDAYEAEDAEDEYEPEEFEPEPTPELEEFEPEPTPEPEEFEPEPTPEPEELEPKPTPEPEEFEPEPTPEPEEFEPKPTPEPMPASMPETVCRPIPPPAPRPTPTPEPMRRPEPQPMPRPTPPPPAPPAPQEPKEEKESKPPITAQLSALAQKVRGRVTAPRQSKQELAEDQEKFGGLDDELAVSGDVQQRLEQARTVVYDSVHRGKNGLTQMKHALYELNEWAFLECYYIGIQLIRNMSDLRRALFRGGVWVKYTIPPFVSKKRMQMVRLFDKLTDSCLEPFRDITSKTRSIKYRLSLHKNGEDEQKATVPSLVLHYLYSLGKPFNRIANFLLPILGCAVLASVILYFQQLNYALEVEYAGVNLGYVTSESDFYEAQSQTYDRLLNEEYVPADGGRPTFRLALVDADKLLSLEALTNRIMALSKNNVITADGIYIDGAFLGAVEDGSEFLLYIDSILQNYRTATEHERVQFVKKVSVQRGIYPSSSIRPIHEIKNALEGNEAVPQSYTVAEGDTLATIAETHNTTTANVLALNPILVDRTEESQTELPILSTGEEILISQTKLSLGIQVTRRETYTEEIPFDIDYEDDKRYPESYVVPLSAGIKGEREIVADITYVDGEQTAENRISTEITEEPVNARQVRGTLRPAQFLPAGSDTEASFLWPVDGGYISCGLYGYPGHTGTDIACPQGTAIRAARSGTVSFAVNYSSGAYGRQVLINHGNGVSTRYAHCSQVLVKSGDYVTQGQLIAKVGRTGNAYGNHCHFEIIINGRIMNPVDFIGTYYPGR